jgi:hypothetical protein
LFAGLLASNDDRLSAAIARLATEFGSIDLRSDIWDFTATDYYRDELGDHIRRQFVSFANLIASDCLPDIKRRTNELEREAPGAVARREARPPARVRTPDASPGPSGAVHLAAGESPWRLERPLAGETPAPQAPRVVNIDPGYLTLSKVVLATTKDYSHRLYLRDGIYAEVTLHYESGVWRPWPWTYRDYASGQYSEFFERVRESLKQQLHRTR